MHYTHVFVIPQFCFVLKFLLLLQATDERLQARPYASSSGSTGRIKVFSEPLTRCTTQHIIIADSQSTNKPTKILKIDYLNCLHHSYRKSKTRSFASDLQSKANFNVRHLS